VRVAACCGLLVAASMLGCEQSGARGESAGRSTSGSAAAPTSTAPSPSGFEARAGSSADASVGPPDGSRTPAGAADGGADRDLQDGGSVSAGACREDMALVAGNYCPGAAQKCLEVHKEYENAQKLRERRRAEGQAEEPMTSSERCLR